MLIEKRNKNHLLGWIPHDKKPEAATITLTIADVKILELSLSEIITHHDGNRYYFKASLPNELLAIQVIRELVSMNLESDGQKEVFKIFQPLKETLKLLDLDLGKLNSTVKLAPPDHREALRRAVEYGTNTFSNSKQKKKTVCIVTYANDSGGWFDVFYNHYGHQLGDPDLIYVITPKPDSFSKFKLGGVIGIRDVSFDDTSKSQALSGLAKSLSAYYDWIIATDVDEMIFPNHASKYRTIAESLEHESFPDINFSIGPDIIQTGSDPDYDLRIPLHSQRRFAIPNSGMCKPHITRGDVNYDVGLHYCRVPPKLPIHTHGFFMFHMKYACKNRHADVAKIVKNTTYSDSNTGLYCWSSVAERKVHPAIATGIQLDTIPLHAWDITAFQQKILSRVYYDADRDLHIGSNFVENFIIEIDTLPALTH